MCLSCSSMRLPNSSLNWFNTSLTTNFKLCSALFTAAESFCNCLYRITASFNSLRHVSNVGGMFLYDDNSSFNRFISALHDGFWQYAGALLLPASLLPPDVPSMSYVMSASLPRGPDVSVGSALDSWLSVSPEKINIDAFPFVHSNHNSFRFVAWRDNGDVQCPQRRIHLEN